MFSECLCGSVWDKTSRRGWTTLASFAVQSLGIGFVLALPLIYTQGLPQLKLISSVIPMPAPLRGALPQNPQSHPATGSVSNLWNGHIMTIDYVPQGISRVDDHDVAPPNGPTGPFVPGSTGTGDPSGILYGLGQPSRGPEMPRLAVQHPPRVSAIMEGHLVHRVEPVYPHLAILGRIQGPVVLRAIISKEGRIENLQIVKGHPLLAEAAVDAVRQWRYRPYELNDEPVEVETQVTVNFVLSGS
jgi:periplasmic protein TonB